MKIKLSVFRGIVPRTEARLLQETQAQTAQNCDLSSGILGAIKAPGLVTSLPDSSRISIFPYNSSWLSWTTDVNVVESPIDEDQYNRIYYTGNGVPKIRGIESSVEHEYALGLPKPVTIPTCTAQAKSTVTWTRSWSYQYEESNGEISQSGTLTEGAYGGTTVNEVIAGKQYRMEDLPAKTTASATATFIIWFDAYDENVSLLGRLYPSTSAYANNRDFYLDGAKGTGSLSVSGAAPKAVLDITYDTSRASEYEIDRYYRYCFVSGWGEEGPLSEPSLMVAVDPTQDCNLTTLDAAIPAYNAALTYKQGQAVTQAGHYYVANQDIDTAEAFTATHWDDYGTSNLWNITKKHIYRTVTGDAGTYYKYVAEVSYATTSYLDEVTDEDTGEESDNADWLMPPSGMSGIVGLPGGIMAGFKDHTIYFCEPYYPHAWPRQYAQTVHYTVKGISVNSSGLVVLTTNGHPYLITGSYPSAMVQQKIDSTQACESKRSIAVYGDATNAVVVYASPDGLTVVEGGIAKVISERIWTREQWQALSPSTMIGAISEGRYFGVSSSASIIFPLSSIVGVEPVTTDETATGMYSDLETDTLYLIQSDKINSWLSGTTYKTLTWKSKLIVTERRGSFNTIRVRAASYSESVIAKIYGNGSLVSTITITNDVARRIPTLRDETKWEIQVEAKTDIYEVLLGTNMKDL